IDHRHDLLDLTDDAGANLVDAIAEAHRRQELIVDRGEVLFGKPALAYERFVDDLIEFRIMPGRIRVPNFKIARRRRLAQSFDLPHRRLSMGDGPAVLFKVRHTANTNFG